VPSSLGGRNAGTNTVVTILIDEYKPRWTFLHIEDKSAINKKNTK
jgi:hypothetical protein